ncbi:MAG: hypothetical protein ABIH00_06785 [Armatimonadota bacterium]
MDSLEIILTEFTKIDGVKQAQVSNSKGEEICTVLRQGLSAISVSEVLKELGSLSASVIEPLFKKKSLKDVFLNADDLSINAYFFKNDISLIIVFDEKANLGRIRLLVRKNQEILEKMNADKI